MDILEKIKRLQKERGWNNAQLAKQAQLPPTTLQGLYKRNNTPTIPTLHALCSAFGITIAQFFADSNVPPDLTPDQIKLLELWNTMRYEQKDALFTFLQTLLP